MWLWAAQSCRIKMFSFRFVLILCSAAQVNGEKIAVELRNELEMSDNLWETVDSFLKMYSQKHWYNTFTLKFEINYYIVPTTVPTADHFASHMPTTSLRPFRLRSCHRVHTSNTAGSFQPTSYKVISCTPVSNTKTKVHGKPNAYFIKNRIFGW